MTSLAQLQCYQVARQLNLLHDSTTLHTASHTNDDDDVEAPVAGTLLSWLYRDALPRDTQHTLQTTQGILCQWLSTHVTRSELAEDNVARDVFMISEQILSFLTVNDLAAVITTTQEASLLIEAEAPALPASTAHHEEQQPQADTEGTLNTQNEEAEAIGSATHAVQQNEEEEEAARQLLRRPMFYLYPTIGVHSTSATHSQHNVTQTSMNDASVVHRIFVRMAHTTMLNEESLNPYFGRYGQVSCTLQRRLRLSDLCSHDLTNNNNSDEAHEESSSGSKPHTRSHAHSSSNSGNSSSSMAIMLFAELYHCLPQELWLQDFVIVVDSYENALRALERAHYKELLFIALHDPALNNFSLAELDTLLAEWPTSTVAIRLGEESTTTSMMRRTAAAVQRRQRKRARQQQGDTSDKRARTEADMSSSSSSSDEEEDDTDVHSGHTASRAASPPAAEDESGVATRGTSDTDFVPDLVIDGFPYWMTEDQLRAIVQEHGTVRALHMSIDDHSGAFTGAVMLRMSSIAEAIALSEAMDKLVYKGCTLRCGVLTPELAMTDIMTGEVRVEGPPLPEGFDVTLNECLYV